MNLVQLIHCGNAEDSFEKLKGLFRVHHLRSGSRRSLG